MKKESRQVGFTLVELMIVISVIAILATLGLVGFRSAQASARDTQRMNNVRGVQAALECYLSVNGTYPSTITWNSMTELGDCWSGGSSGVDTIPAGDSVAADGVISRGSSTAGTYTYSRGTTDDTYSIILYGESRTVTLKSPS